MVNKSKISIALEEYEEAEELLRAGILVAKRNLGDDHIGTLLGQYHLARVLVKMKRYDEAEQKLVELIEQQKGKFFLVQGNHHPDRLGAMVQLFECYKGQGRTKESAVLCGQILEGFEKLSVREHPLATRMKKEQLIIAEHLEVAN